MEESTDDEEPLSATKRDKNNESNTNNDATVAVVKKEESGTNRTTEKNVKLRNQRLHSESIGGSQDSEPRGKRAYSQVIPTKTRVSTAPDANGMIDLTNDNSEELAVKKRPKNGVAASARSMLNDESSRAELPSISSDDDPVMIKCENSDETLDQKKPAAQAYFKIHIDGNDGGPGQFVRFQYGEQTCFREIREEVEEQLKPKMKWRFLVSLGAVSLQQEEWEVLPFLDGAGEGSMANPYQITITEVKE